MLLSLLTIAIIGFLLLRLLIVELQIFGYINNVFPKCAQLRTMIVAGSGGHTTEILRLVNSLSKHYSPRLYVIASSDAMSPEKIKISELNSNDFSIHSIPRSREVLQSYLTSVLTTVRSAAYCFPLVAWEKPDLVLCNGPGTCIPVCFAAFLYRLLLLKDCRIVFVESICRVNSLSLSGRILYYLADHVIVQWPELLDQFPRARYLGRIV
ncbi:hypothetical protein BOX15_Mlig024127g1 [Macrostomum lignano]|uniref:Uncharacterized protein n=2 Tax=Macrostomum lignano TaxID=282301 RepID=A0A267FF62_9PLAT|nr:hypothetical protein BOX15_Mlig016892g2 [Macrostomum lignano]PAA72408.1 hypothetical protein BOX15_Mlig024127g1 [Macrostomum lignano]